MMKTGCKDTNIARDLTRGASAWFFWCLPIAMLIAGGTLRPFMAWLWFVAFVIMGAGCAINALRCRRLHCYVTGPLFLLAALWSLLAAARVVPLHPNVLSLAVLIIAVLACGAEIPLGRYLSGRPG